MRADPYIKLVLTVIAVALCVIAFPHLEATEVLAASGQPGVMAGNELPAEEPHSPVGPRFVPTHVGPLRWRIGFAAERNPDGDKEECHTVISLVNTAPTPSQVEVSFIDYYGANVGGKTATVNPDNPYVIITNTGGSYAALEPFLASWLVDTGFFSGGFVFVWADDPRVLATGFLTCRDDYRLSYQINSGLTITNLPAHPVGATMEYFQAGMPATWTPPMAEVPE